MVHFSSINNSGTGNQNMERMIVFIYFFIFMIRKNITALLHKRKLFLYLFRHPKVIGIQKSDPFALCFAQRAVAGQRGAAVCFVFKKTNPRITQKRSENLFGVVGGAVIYKQQLPVFIRLSDYGTNRLRQKPSRVPRRHNDGYQPLFHFRSLLCHMFFLPRQTRCGSSCASHARGKTV